jgi:hypothetical protein
MAAKTTEMEQHLATNVKDMMAAANAAVRQL